MGHLIILLVGSLSNVLRHLPITTHPMHYSHRQLWALVLIDFSYKTISVKLKNRTKYFIEQEWNDFNLWPQDIPFQDFFKTHLSRLLFQDFFFKTSLSQLFYQDFPFMTFLSWLHFHDFYCKTLFWKLFFIFFYYLTCTLCYVWKRPEMTKNNFRQISHKSSRQSRRRTTTKSLLRPLLTKYSRSKMQFMLFYCFHAHQT